MKRLLEIILYSSVVFGLLTLCSCSKDEIQTGEVKIESATSFEDDELYGRLTNDSTVEDYINVFLEDAKRHGVDYTGLIQSTNIRWEESPLFTNYNGGSWNAGDPYNIDIMIGREFWKHLNFDGTFKDGHYSYPSVYFRVEEYIPYYKLKLIYHELGHDILGLTHICEPGQIMTDNDPCGRLEGIPGDRFGLYNMATLEYLNKENPLADWNRAIDDLFTPESQTFTTNRSSFFD